jgi:WD40 repeat protein
MDSAEKEGRSKAAHIVGDLALSASADHSVRLWDAQTGKEMRKYEGHTEQVFSVAFGPEGLAISADHLGRMHLWELNTGKNAGVFACHSHPDGLNATPEQLVKLGGVLVNTVAYSEKAKLAVTCGANQSIRLWNLETGKVRKLTHTDYAHVCFSPDGKRLAGLYHEVLRVWDVETGKVLFGIDRLKASCVAFSPDGKRLVTGGSEDNTVRVWDASGKELRKYPNQQRSYVGCVMFFPDGNRIASVSGNDGLVRIWRAPR